MIETNMLTFSYRKHPVFSELSFKAADGEVTYLAGANGAGKTTWIKCAVDLLKAKSGTVIYDGKPFEEVRDDFAICFDTPPFYKHLSSLDNLEVLYGVPKKDDGVLSFLRDIGIDNYLAGKKAGQLSYGQTHRLGIAGAVLRKPKYLMMDEPDLGLDPMAWKALSFKIEELKKEGAAIVITGQNFMQLQGLIDHVVLMADGAVRADMTKDEFIKEYGQKETLIKAFSGDNGEAEGK